jgi:hypothetical protein
MSEKKEASRLDPLSQVRQAALQRQTRSDNEMTDARPWPIVPMLGGFLLVVYVVLAYFAPRLH